MKYYFLTSLFITILFPVTLLPQSLHFTNYTTKNGLSNNKVNAILQDKNGFIWIGTEDGLNRYDGYDFKIYRNNPEDSLSLSDNNIWTLFEDTAGNIWIGTNSGFLNKYDQKKNIFYNWQLKNKGTNEVEITSLLQDKEGSMWIGTYQDGLYRLNISNGKIQHWSYDLNDVNSLSNNFVTSILEDSSGSTWISTYNGLNRLRKNSEEKFFEKYYYDPSSNNSLPANLVWNVSQSILNPEIIWIGTANGLASFDTRKEMFNRFEINSDERYQFGNSIASIIEEVVENDTIFWLGTYAGLVRINKRTNHTDRFMKNEIQPGSIVSNRINDIIKDRSGVIWIATENGISKLSSKSVRFNNLFSGGVDEILYKELFGKSVKAITKDKSGKIYFGTGNGIISLDPVKDNLIFKYPQTEKLNVWSLESDGQGNLWIGTYGQGLKYFNLHTGKIKDIKIESPTFKTSAFDYIKSLQLDNDELLIGFWGGGLARLDTKTGKYKVWIKDANDPFSISYNDVWSIIKDRKNRIWIGTNGGGLNLLSNSDEGKFFKPLSENSGLSSNSIYALCEAKNYVHSKNENQTIIWIGTSSGLDKLKVSGNPDDQDFSSIKFEVTNYSTKNEIIDNSVKNIIEDKNGNLWLSSGTGILFFDVKNETFINYSEADGITGNEFNSGASNISDDGIMYFGSIGGLNFFDPEQISLSSFKPTLLITDFQIFNQPVSIGGNSVLSESINNTETIELSYSQNVFSFQLSSLDYNYPASIQYAYQMEGFDRDWIYSGSRRFITYTNLASGKYVFKFKATNSDGVWNENYNSVIVNIDPPWWRTPWSYVLYFLLIIAGVFTLQKFEMNRAKLRNELKMREFEAKKQRELETMKSRFFANLSHEFRTPLTLIRGPVEELIKGKADHPEEYYDLIHRNSEKLQVLIDQLLELTRLENAAIPLKAKKEDLVKLLRGMFSTFDSLAQQKNISLKFYSEKDAVICWIDRDKLEKIINNLLSNAFKFTPENGKVEIEIKTTPKFVQILICDSGIGIPEEKLDKIFDRFYQVDDSSRKNFGGSGIGLALVKELVDLHKWEIDVKSEEEVGTEFILRIPFGDTYVNENEKETGQAPIEIEEEISVRELTDEQIELNEKEIEKEILEKNKLLSAKPIILIVEDSEDVRNFLSSLLKNDYRLTEAVDGEDGLKKSAELLPDLIISDVMMPSMDGIEFCKNIKTEIQTSHIPVILLTAKASFESKLEGLETGADDYLTKPFSSKELLVRIKNLLEQRKTLREKFSKEISIDSFGKIETSAVTVNSLDNEFLQKAFDVAEKNLSNSEFNSEEFAKEMFLSRSQFHRKLIAVTGQGPGEFLRTFRLKKAASMIFEKRLSVTQITFEVGFNSPSHFTKAFQKQFNCLPSEFIRDSS